MSDKKPPSNECPSNYKPVEDPSNNNIGSMGEMLLGKLAAASQGCDTKSFSAQVAGSVSGPFGLGSAKAGASTAYVQNSGCQALETVIGNYLNSVYQARCLINNNTAISTVDINIRQDASITASGAGTIVYPPSPLTCPRPSIKQTVKLSLKDLSTMSTSTANQMASVVAQGMTNTCDQLAKQTTGFQATPQGLSMIQAMQSKVQQSLSDSSITESIQETSKKVSVSQDGSIKASNGAVVYAPCNITQDAILDLQLAEIISSAYAATVQSELSAFLTSAQKQSAEIKNEGSPNPFGLFSDNWGLIAGIVVALILGIVVVKVIKSKTAQQAVSEYGQTARAGIKTVGEHPELLAAAFRFF